MSWRLWVTGALPINPKLISGKNGQVPVPEEDRTENCASESGCPKLGAEDSAERGACPFLFFYLQRHRARSTLFGTLLGTPFWASAFRSTFFQHFSWWGLRHFFRWPAGSVACVSALNERALKLEKIKSRCSSLMCALRMPPVSQILQYLQCQVVKSRKVAERKFPEFFGILSRILPRILLRIFPGFFEDFPCFVSWETETRKNSPKIPAIFQCKIPRQTRTKIFTKFFWRAGKARFLSCHGLAQTFTWKDGNENTPPVAS